MTDDKKEESAESLIRELRKKANSSNKQPSYKKLDTKPLQSSFSTGQRGTKHRPAKSNAVPEAADMMAQTLTNLRSKVAVERQRIEKERAAIEEEKRLTAEFERMIHESDLLSSEHKLVSKERMEAEAKLPEGLLKRADEEPTAPPDEVAPVMVAPTSKVTNKLATGVSVLALAGCVALGILFLKERKDSVKKVGFLKDRIKGLALQLKAANTRVPVKKGPPEGIRKFGVELAWLQGWKETNAPAVSAAVSSVKRKAHRKSRRHGSRKKKNSIKKKKSLLPVDEKGKGFVY